MFVLKKRCWVCGSIENTDGNCTKNSCPRYIKETTNTVADTTENASSETVTNNK